MSILQFVSDYFIDEHEMKTAKLNAFFEWRRHIYLFVYGVRLVFLFFSLEKYELPADATYPNEIWRKKSWFNELMANKTNYRHNYTIPFKKLCVEAVSWKRIEFWAWFSVRYNTEGVRWDKITFKTSTLSRCDLIMYWRDTQMFALLSAIW